MPDLVGVWHGRMPGDRWKAKLETGGRAVISGGGLTVAGARRFGAAVAGVDGALYRVGDREPPADPAEALASEWLEVGDRVLQGMRGEAALVLAEPDRRRGLIARDQLGIGCLYLRRMGDCVAFASSIARLIQLTGSAEPDDDSVACWLARGELPPGATLYAGIARLGAGEALLFDPEGCRRWRYWSPGGAAGPRQEVGADAVRSAIVTAVRRRVASGEAATLLSGGLDSTAIAATAALGLDAEPRSVQTYSAVFPEHPAQDESDWIAATARELGLRAATMPVRAGSVVTAATEWAERCRLPLPSPSWLYQGALLDRMAGDSVTVALDGEGGDELFGADRFLVSDALRHGHPLHALQLVRRYPGAGDGPPLRAMLHFLTRHGVRGALSPARHSLLRRESSGGGPPWLALWAERRAATLVDPWRWKQAGRPRALSHLSFALTEAPDSIGAREYFRRKGEPSGVRPSHPLLDLDLVELVLSGDLEAAYDPYLSRPLLRAVMRGWVPDRILERTDKARFEPLFVDCMTGPDAGSVTGLLGDPAARVLEWTRPELLRELFARGPGGHPGGAHRWADHGFRLVATEIWLRSLE